MRDLIRNHMAKRVEIYDTCALIDSSRDSLLSVSTATDEREEKKNYVIRVFKI